MDSGHNGHTGDAPPRTASDGAAAGGRDGPPAPPGLLVSTLRQLAHVAGRHLDRVLAPLDLSGTSVAALRQLAAEPSLSAAELARRVLITPQSVGPVLDRLDALGLVVRHRSGVRGAKVLTEVTDAGRARLAEANAVVADLDRWLLGELTAARQRELADSLALLLERAAASAGE